MAPLLGRKPYPLVKPLSEPPGPGEEVYTIEHTKEAFRNKEYPFFLSPLFVCMHRTNKHVPVKVSDRRFHANCGFRARA